MEEDTMILSWVIMAAWEQYGNLEKKSHAFPYIYKDKENIFCGAKQ